MATSVAGIIVIDSLVFIAKRIPVGDMGGRWEFPGGKVDGNETPEETLKREFLEEFNAEVVVKNHICDAEFEHRGKPVTLKAYEVAFKDEDDISWVLTEHTDISWVTFDDIKSLNFVDSDMKIYPEVRKYFEN